MHPLEEREPYRELYVEHWAWVGEVAADLGHLEAGDPLEGGVGPVDGLVTDTWIVGPDPAMLMDFRTAMCPPEG